MRNALRSPVSDPFPPPFHRSFSQRLRSWFFTGLIVFGPIAVTAYIAWWVINTIDNWVRPWLPNILSPDAYLPFHIPGFGVVIAIVGLTLLGFLTANFIGRSLVRFGEAMLDRTPLVRGVHKGLKQVFETIFSQSGSQFRKVGLVQFPGSRQLVDRLHLFGPARDHRQRLAGEEADDLRLHALHAQPHHRILFLYPGRPGRRIADFRRRGRETDHVGGPRPAARAGGAGRNGGSGEARKADVGDGGVRRRALGQADDDAELPTGYVRAPMISPPFFGRC